MPISNPRINDAEDTENAALPSQVVPSNKGMIDSLSQDLGAGKTQVKVEDGEARGFCLVGSILGTLDFSGDLDEDIKVRMSQQFYGCVTYIYTYIYTPSANLGNFVPFFKVAEINI